MTRAELRAMVTAHCQQQGVIYHADDTAKNTAINQALAEISGLTYCFFSDNLNFVPDEGVRSYDFDKPSAKFLNGSTQVGLVQVVQVWHTLGGAMTPVLDFFGRPGPVSMHELLQRYPNYLSTSAHPNGAPSHWYHLGPSTIALFPAPPASPGTWKVAAYYQHPPLAADGDEVLLPARFERDAALYIAHQWIYANAAGESRATAGEYLALAQDTFRRFGTEMRSRMAPDYVRGGADNSVVYLNQG